MLWIFLYDLYLWIRWTNMRKYGMFTHTRAILHIKNSSSSLRIPIFFLHIFLVHTKESCKTNVLLKLYIITNHWECKIQLILWKDVVRHTQMHTHINIKSLTHILTKFCIFILFIWLHTYLHIYVAEHWEIHIFIKIYICMCVGGNCIII